MYIGKINDRYAPIEWRAVKSEGGAPVPFREAGNPFCGERLTVDWSALAPFGLDLMIQIPGEILLETVVLRFGAKSEPHSVSLIETESQRMIDCYHGETGRAIAAKEIALHADGCSGEVTVRIEAGLSDVILEQVELYGADPRGEQLYPTPHSVTFGEDRFAVADYRTYSVDCPEALPSAAVLSEKLAERASVSLSAVDDGQIRFAMKAEITENGYCLSVTADRILIEASDVRGFVQGAETLIKLIDGDMIPACRMEDAPFCAFRGAHLFLPAPDQMAFAKRLIKYILSPMGYNHIILELAGAMEFRSHPEINEAFCEANRRAAAGEWPPFPHGSVGGRQLVSQEAIRDFVAYARGYGIEIIPEIQSLGHVQFMTQAHPEIAERPADAPRFEATDERLADIPPNDFYAHCFCPSNPRSYEILFDLMEEVVEVFQPAKYVHMGHDEIYQIGVCPVCRQRDPADLLAEDLCRLHDWLSARGLTMMIWSDMLQPVTKYKTPAAIHRIPRDIVMLDFIWYFHTDKDIEDNLLAENFEVIMGNMYSSHYPRYESRIRKSGMRGAEVSAWVPTEEEALSREGKLYDFLYSAQMLWSDRYTAHARYAYDRVISAMMPALRAQMQGVKYPSLAAHGEHSLWDGGAFDPKATIEKAEIEAEGCYDSLVIEHTLSKPRHRLPWVELEAIGQYEIVYADGTEAALPVTYAGNISHAARRHHEPFGEKYYRHNGYTTAWETDGLTECDVNGDRVTFYRIEWRKPYPEKALAYVRYRAVEGKGGDLFLRRVICIRA